MAYTKHTWVTGETITAANLNHLEDGVVAVSANGAIGTANLADGAVTNAKLSANAVTSAKIANNSITDDELADGAVVTAKIEDGAVTNAKIATAAVSGTQIADETITATNIADETLTEAKLDPTFAASLAKVDGSYEGMTVGNAEQLVSTVGVEDSAPYTFRTTGGSADVGDRMNLKAAIGGTVAWNQLVQTNSASVNVPSGHKYLSRINGTNTIAISNGSAISINDGTKDNVFDLAAMFGSAIADYAYTLESGTAGAGIEWLKKYGWFMKPYYPYAAASLQSVKTSAHKTVGFNAYNPSTGKAKVVGGMVYQITGAYTALSLDGTSITPDANGYFTPSANGELTVTGGNGTTTCVHLKWDGERDGEYEPYSEHTYALDDVELRGIPKLDASNNLYYDGDRYLPDGTVNRRYTEHSVVASNLLNNGGDDVNSIYRAFYHCPDRAYTTNVVCDRFTQGSAETPFAIGVRTNGDGIEFRIPYSAIGVSSSDTDNEKLTAAKAWFTNNVTKLVYELATPTTESADSFVELQICNDFGTEEFTDAATRDFEMPCGSLSVYQPNLRAKLEMAPNSPSNGNGDYIVRQTDGVNEYVLFSTVKELPDFPTTDGNYKLRCTVSSGTATLTWVSE